jgi:hypothetical protein
MNGIQKLMIGGKEILSIDYSDCKEDEMINRISELAEMVFAENKRIVLLSIFNDKSFVTPKVMRHVENRTSLLIHLIDKMAMIGLSPTKKVILNGYNLIFKREFKAFDTRDEAIAYLVDDNRV